MFNTPTDPKPDEHPRPPPFLRGLRFRLFSTRLSVTCVCLPTGGLCVRPKRKRMLARKGGQLNFSLICLHFKKFFLPLPLKQNSTVYMKKVPLSSLRKGDFFHLKDDINSPIWIRGHYDRSSRKYSIFPYDDIFRELFRKPTVSVFVESY